MHFEPLFEPSQVALAQGLGVGEFEQPSAEIFTKVVKVRRNRVGASAKVEFVRQVESAIEEPTKKGVSMQSFEKKDIRHA